MNIITLQKECLGCAACIDICPFDALTLTKDKDGFYAPSINSEKCVDCGKCAKICPALNKADVQMQSQYFYGWNNDEKIRASSSSGGIFSALADSVLKSDGVVLGAVYSDGFKSVLMDSSDNVSLDSLRRSKYVQSNATGLYKKIAKALEDNRKVLAVGTPCQIAAIRNIFGSENKNLILVDFLCGGVASPDCYLQYIEWLEKRYKSKVLNVNFRNKKNGWSKLSIKIDFENGRSYYSAYMYDPYYYYYFTPYMKNKACLSCAFTNTRYADITIADFWGFRYANITKDEKGMSLIAVHTERGGKLLTEIKDFITLYPLSEKDAEYGFKPKNISNEQIANREKFLADVRNSGFMAVTKQNYYKNGKMGIFFRKSIKKIKNIFTR